jgi:Ca2+:H+ antiporter
MSAAGTHTAPVPRWPIVVPSAAVAVLLVSLLRPVAGALAAVCGIALVGAVIAAVHHAEVVAHRIGEPFGTLVLAIAVTVIEASLIISLLLAGGEHTDVLVRDTVYATVMIIATGVNGLCILLGSIRHREQQFRIEGAGPAFAALAALAVLVLIMPVFTVSAPAALYTTSQLAFVAVCSLLLWCVFVFFQTVSHRDYFLPPTPTADVGTHAPAPTNARALASLGLLFVALAAVVVLAKQLSPAIEIAVATVNAPRALVGICVAVLVLLPESLAAARAALANRMQTSLNLALGSALATIGLTIPVVVIVCIAFDIPIVLGLAAKDIVLLMLTLLVGAVGIGNGRTNLMYGAVQIVIFAAFLFLALVP